MRETRRRERPAIRQLTKSQGGSGALLGQKGKRRGDDCPSLRLVDQKASHVVGLRGVFRELAGRIDPGGFTPPALGC